MTRKERMHRFRDELKASYALMQSLIGAHASIFQDMEDDLDLNEEKDWTPERLARLRKNAIKIHQMMQEVWLPLDKAVKSMDLLKNEPDILD